MKIKFYPQRSDEKLEYEFNGEVVTATLNGQSDTFDFSSFPNGQAKIEEIETNLPVNPIVSAERVDGELRVVLLYYHGIDATQEELFPQWQVIE